MIDGERTLPDRRLGPGGRRRTPAERMLDAGIPELLFERFGERLEWHSPWHHGRVLLAPVSRLRSTSPRQMRCCASRPRRPSIPRQRGDRAADGGDRGRRTPITWYLAERARRRGSRSIFGPAATRRRTASRSATRSRTSRPRPRSAASSRRERPAARRGAARGARAVPERHRHRGRDGRRFLRGRRLDPRRARLTGGPEADH